MSNGRYPSGPASLQDVRKALGKRQVGVGGLDQAGGVPLGRHLIELRGVLPHHWVKIAHGIEDVFSAKR